MTSYLNSLQGLTGPALVGSLLALAVIALLFVLLVKWVRRRRRNRLWRDRGDRDASYLQELIRIQQKDREEGRYRSDG